MNEYAHLIGQFFTAIIAVLIHISALVHFSDIQVVLGVELLKSNLPLQQRPTLMTCAPNA